MTHEVNRPIATIINAQGTLRFLVTQTPHLEGIRLALARIVRNANRARDLINGLRGLMRSLADRFECLSALFRRFRWCKSRRIFQPR
jgi:signal transduction histidine kinase